MNYSEPRQDEPASRTRQSRVALFLALAALLASPISTVDAQRAVAPGAHVPFTATAYCDKGTTKAGVRTIQGVAAADPKLLPVGSVVRLVTPEQPRYEGIYTVMDTGSAVQGRKIDLFVPNCGEARQFGLKRVLVRILRLGWSPRASEGMTAIDRRSGSNEP